MANLLRHQPHHNPVIGEVPVPHGPETGDETETWPADGVTTAEERALFRYLTHPDDSYTKDGTYWADLPLRQRVGFVNKVNNAESKAELQSIWAMFKQDPLSPVSWYFRNAVLPGAGLGLEGYVLFSIGNIEPLFESAFPTCWGKATTVCSQNWQAAVTYLEVIGIMAGQMAVGVSRPVQRWAVPSVPPATRTVFADLVQ